MLVRLSERPQELYHSKAMKHDMHRHHEHVFYHIKANYTVKSEKEGLLEAEVRFKKV